MGKGCNPDECDKQCTDHGINKLLLTQNTQRVGDIEDYVEVMSNSVSKMEGRFSSFTWIMGLMMLSLIALASYGVVQLSLYKDIDHKVTIDMTESLAVLKTEVTHLKEAVE